MSEDKIHTVLDKLIRLILEAEERYRTGELKEKFVSDRLIPEILSLFPGSIFTRPIYRALTPLLARFLIKGVVRALNKIIGNDWYEHKKK